ncbi:transcriptional regulator [Desulfosporosinus sp. I2]|uniref:TetR-like C-terminal domain-containing protein n=1 Tax=Desulfosporosinus sp. I2 TaxID=1617025 RepID=UPI0005ED7D2F|nr:TetR-like C-terminal domain-containing protein [Desulfosporosinus sp. I2]KJR49238.1 transcriptional regulator [Desulfosporosinus sp. I2]
MPRSSLTKKALATSLKRLMEKFPLHKIKVQEIVDDCELNRQTFYYHFQDIYALLGWIYTTEAVESIANYKTYTTWEDGFLKIFLYIGKNKAFCLNTLNSLGRDHLDTFLHSIAFELLMGVVTEVSQDMKVKDEDKKFMADFYALAFIGLVIQWMKTGMKEKPEVIIEKLSELVEGNFASALQRYEKRM